jgi:hypothetical protein
MNAKLDRHGDMLLVSDVLCTDADVQQANHQVWFPGAAIEPVVEFGYIVLEMLLLDFVMSAQQKPLQVRQRYAPRRTAHALAHPTCRSPLPYAQLLPALLFVPKRCLELLRCICSRFLVDLFAIAAWYRYLFA